MMFTVGHHEIPNFLNEQIVYCSALIQRGNKKSYLLLLRNLQLYEYRRKQLISSLNLQSTCLSKVAHAIKDYQGPKGILTNCPGTSVQNADLMAHSESSPVKTVIAFTRSDIRFGKYIYRNLDIYKLYVLLICWDKLLVLLKSSDGSEYDIQAEYEEVADFKLVYGKIKFEVFVEIHFENGGRIRTNFNEQLKSDGDNPLKKPSTSEFNELLDRVRIITTELHIHKTVTQRNFERLRDSQAFGCNVVRSHRLEEKQMIGRCGDYWIRFTTDDTLVLGFPLVNNCASPNLTVAKNVRPVLKPNEHSVKGIKYEYRLYQLQQKFENLDSVESYFQSEDDDLQDSNWVINKQQHLLPDSFGVLLIKVNICEIILAGDCPIFLYFDVEKDLCLKTNVDGRKTQIYEQQIFLKNVNFQHILSKRQAHEICFRETTLHQDFLAIAISSIETSIAIKFKSRNDLTKFEKLFTDKFNFENIRRDKKIKSEFSMEIDDIELDATTSNTTTCHTLYYNKHANSMWYGLLVLEEVNGHDEVAALWKFYTKTKEKAYLLIKLLFDDLVSTKCNVEHITYPVHKRADIKIAEFEHALRQELMALVSFIKTDPYKPNTHDELVKLLKLQTKTDQVAQESANNWDS